MLIGLCITTLYTKLLPKVILARSEPSPLKCRYCLPIYCTFQYFSTFPKRRVIHFSTRQYFSTFPKRRGIYLQYLIISIFLLFPRTDLLISNVQLFISAGNNYTLSYIFYYLPENYERKGSWRKVETIRNKKGSDQKEDINEWRPERTKTKYKT